MSNSDDPDQRIITVMLVGAVIGGAYGWLFLQDTTAGIVEGIGTGTLLAMVYPEKTDEALATLDNLWRLTDHALKTIVSEAYDDYGRLPLDDRLRLVTMPDFLASFVLTLRRRVLDPPD